MRFKIAMYAALAALALGPPAKASQGNMFSNANQCAVTDHFNFVGSSGALPAVAIYQEVLLSGDSPVMGFTHDSQLRDAVALTWAPAMLNQVPMESDTGPVSFVSNSYMYTIYGPSDSSDHFRGSVILKLSHAAPANSAGNMLTNSFWLENDLDNANKGAPAASQLKI